MNPVDLFICAFERQEYTAETIKYLRERTRHPYRLFLIDNGGNEYFKDKVNHYIQLRPNMGIMAAWNIALELAETEYFITSDNDIYVPKLEPDWLTQMVRFMDDRLDYGAISLHPHVFIGAAGIDPADPEDVKDRNMCGAVMRIMRTEMIRKVGGWDKVIRSQRNGEERCIAARLHSAGFKTGIATRIRAYHPFGGVKGNWGYAEEITPEMQGHNPALKDYVSSFDNPSAYDENTFLPKA